MHVFYQFGPCRKELHSFAGYEKLTDLGVMNVLSLYLLLGIGVDDLYVMTDAFRQARNYFQGFFILTIARLLLIKFIVDFVKLKAKQSITSDDGTVIPVTKRLRLAG